MTAVAPPITFQQPIRPGWSSNSLNGSLSHDDLTRALNMPTQQPRKTIPRSNSNSSINSQASTSTATSSATLNQPITGVVADPASINSRIVMRRGGFLPSTRKAEPTAGLSTARPQPVSSNSSGPSAAAAAASALHAPMLPSQQITNGKAQQNATVRNGNPPQDPTAILHLLPINGTFERKTITVPFYPDVLRIGRQTNQKTAPTPSNAFFDSKVLSRQHAEIWADRSHGRVFIRDVKSSNGTFVNGKRLSPENQESEPHPLNEQDVLELGIDIVSEDQKTVVHHKVAARVEHAGIYAPEMNFAEPEPPGVIQIPGGLKRNGSQSSVQSVKMSQMAAAMTGRDLTGTSQYQQPRTMFTPITTETIVRKLNV